MLHVYAVVGEDARMVVTASGAIQPRPPSHVPTAKWSITAVSSVAVSSGAGHRETYQLWQALEDVHHLPHGAHANDVPGSASGQPIKLVMPFQHSVLGREAAMGAQWRGGQRHRAVDSIAPEKEREKEEEALHRDC